MKFLRKIFNKSPKNQISPDSTTQLAEGDIFYTFIDQQYHIYKLLKIDNEIDTFHVLNYKSQTTLPEKDRIGELTVQIYHFPIDKNGFTDLKVLTNSVVTEDDLIGYHEYLRQTQGFDEIAVKANSYFSEAYELTDEKKHEEAIEKYSMAIELVPDFYEAIDNRAFCKMDLGRWTDAIEDFRLSLAINPESLLAEFSIGECFLRLSDYQQAKEQFEKALIIDPSHQPSQDFLIKANQLLQSSS